MIRHFYLLLIPCIFPAFTFGQILFSDVTNQSGLPFLGKNYGAAVADYNHDGYEDIFAFSQQVPCRLYRNNGNGTFTDVAPEVGLDYVGTPNVAGWVDVNNDGWLDLFIGNREGHNAFFLGKEDGTFVDNTFLSGLLTGSKVKAVLFSDINLDGLIDIYLARINLDNIMYLNMGNSQFVNFTNNSGTNDPQISMGAVFFDYDNDGDPDLYLTHDANQPNILYQNDGTGRFTNVSVASGTNVAGNGMGVDVADVNNDGWLDIYVTNLYPNFLLLNNGDGTFTEIAEAAGADDFGMGWGCTFLDVDNDGWQDIYAVNDSYFAPYPNLLYRNNQNLTFSVVSEGSPLASLQPGYGTVSLDYNNDGKMDIYLANYIGAVGNQLFRNDGQNPHNWVKIKATGTISNRSAIGARVTIVADGQTWMDEIVGTSGYATQNGFTLHFGLGLAQSIDSLTIRWPNGLVETFENLGVNTTYSFTEGNGFTNLTSVASTQRKDLIISPNPCRDFLLLSKENGLPRISRATLFAADGIMVREIPADTFRNVPNGLQLDTSSLPPGVYFLSLQTPDGVESAKLVKL